MQNCAAVVILMQSISNQLLYRSPLLGLEPDQGLPPLAIFDSRVVDFFAQISETILNSNHGRQFPDLASFGFFCRKRNLDKLARRYLASEWSFGRGITLHFAASNVPLIFAYSLLAGLLAGNTCWVRLPSKIFEQAEILSDIISALIEKDEYNHLSPRISLFQYEHDDQVTRYLTSRCDVRVIWGSDETIARLRQYPLPAKSYDLVFADRYSVCVIDANGYLSRCEAEREARNFFNDTLYFDQNACTSPRLIFWLGDEESIATAQDRFWNAFADVVEKNVYGNNGNMAVEKLLTAYKCAIDLRSECAESASPVHRIKVPELPDNLEPYCTPGGLFLEFSTTSSDDLVKLASRKLQTVTYLGMDAQQVVSSLHGGAVVGVDRIVANGRGGDFDLLWDGFDLITHLSKTLYVR